MEEGPKGAGPDGGDDDNGDSQQSGSEYPKATLLSANMWYKFAKGLDYFVDISKQDFSMLSSKDFPDGPGSIISVNFINRAPASDVALVFGEISVEYLESVF